MRKLLSFGLSLMLLICFIGCSKSNNNTDNSINWAEIYQITLESYFVQDTALNEDIDFIAIDFSTLKFAGDDDKMAITVWFEDRYVPIIDTDLDGLEAEGLYDGDRLYIPDGVLLWIDKVAQESGEVVIEGTRYRGARGANGFESRWLLKDGVWEFTGSVITWIS